MSAAVAAAPATAIVGLLATRPCPSKIKVLGPMIPQLAQNAAIPSCDQKAARKKS